GLAVSLPWEWEVEPNFDKELLNGNIPDEVEHWVDWMGRPYERAGNRVTVMPTEEIIHSTIKGDRLGDPSTLSFRDPETFVAGELHNHLEQWEAIADEIPTPEQLQVLRWIREKVSIFDYFRPFVGRFKGTQYNSVRPPSAQFRNNPSCRPFADFIHYVDARFLNLWMTDMPFKLDNLTHIPRYVGKNTYQTVLDDKSGYDHLLLTEESRPFFGIQWGGWYFVYSTLPFGWKISPFVYHSTGLMASNFFRSSGIPCSLYIDDRHNGQLQVDLTQGAYVAMTSEDDRNLAAGKSAIFVVAYHLIKLGYFLGIAKSILNPSKTVPYLGFISDSGHQVFHLIPEKKEKFIKLVREVLTHSVVSVKTLQRLVGKCVSLSLAVPGALLFTREMNNAISKGLRTHKQVKIDKMLREEISHWLFLESWDDPLPWRDERHTQVSLASDASGYGWGGWMIVDGTPEVTSDYWTEEEYHNDISTKEALALNKTLLSFGDTLRNVWVDALVDNMAVVHTWQRQGGRSIALNRAMKELFFTTVKLNISLHITHISSEKNPADGPSRRLALIDCKLHPTVWHEVQQQFGGETGHTCDLMALDSNTMTDRNGEPLPHFTPTCSPGSSGVNVFAQNVANEVGYLRHPYVFPPLGL
ncbi:hypothetical protein QZH41_009408, partial [Actinostola sp. cb2023]